MKRYIVCAVALVLSFTGAIAAQTPAKLTATRELKIDGEEHLLVPIRQIAVDRKGNIAISQQQDGAIRFFSSNGAPLGKVGRKGGGPGEFKNMWPIGWAGDTLWVYDSDQSRFTLITPQRTVGRVVVVPPGAKAPLQNPSRMPDFSYVYPKSFASNGDMLAQVDIAMPDNAIPSPQFVDHINIARIGGDGVVTRMVASVKLPKSTTVARDGTGKFLGNASLPFVGRALVAQAPDGSRLVIIEAANEGPKAGTFRATAVSAKGDTIYSRTYPFKPTAIPKHVGDSTLDAGYTRMRKMSIPLANAYKRDARVPPMYPPFNEAIVGSDMSTWLMGRADGATRTYYRLSPNGMLAGELTMPKTEMIAAADATHIWTVSSDEDDVESVVRYRISTSPARKR